MKPGRSLRCLLAGAALAAGLPLWLGAAGAPVRLVVAANQAAPYRILENGRWGGFYFEAFDLVAARVGFSYSVAEVPMARGLHMLETGDADVMLGPLRTPEREAFARFTQAGFPAEAKVFYVRPGAPPISTWDDLYGLRIAVLIGASYSERFDRDPRLERDPVGDYGLAIRKVDAGRSDVVLMPELQGDALLRTMGVRLVKCPLSLPGSPSRIAFSRKSKHLDLVPAIERAMAALQAEGVLDRLMARYRE